MIFPSKLVSLQQSILYRSTFILEVPFLKMPLHELYKRTESHFGDPNEFVLAVDLLWILGKLEVDFLTGLVQKC